ncbi:hypothetical protein ACFQ2B_32745 [Streptomyces stramineus]|uniref:Secreted protein n=1 Tax=Streptomyces stramineus TaxID=173861 RepID=A0ABN1AHX2_9ACTN
MSHTIPALGAAVVCASGCVWYLPAVTDLRAGDDRPRSRRLAAAACVTGWATWAAVGVLLSVVESWLMPGTAGALGAAAAAALSVRARTHRAREQREADACWTALRRVTPADTARASRRVFAAWAFSGSALAVPAAVALALPAGAVTAVAAAVVVTALFLLIAVARAVALQRPRS